jgi:hypothetical protein
MPMALAKLVVTFAPANDCSAVVFPSFKSKRFRDTLTQTGVALMTIAVFN